jgi:glutamate carboxypeptidase
VDDAANIDIDGMLADLEALVRAESPSRDTAALLRCRVVLDGIISARLGRAPSRVGGEHGDHLSWSGGAAPRVLILGHYDTVHPIGTIEVNPWAVRDGRVSGPGVFDMKAGIVAAVHGVACLADPAAVEMLFTCDEEVGSGSSRRLIEERAREAGAVLVLEPAADGGALKIARKGTGTFHVRVAGRSAHAGLEPEKGINALTVLAGIIGEISGWAAPERGTTVTATLAAAGTADNVVPDLATCSIDVRVETADEKDRLDALFAGLVGAREGAEVTVTGAIARPPMPASASTELFGIARRLGEDLGIEVRGVAVGGGSDGNLTAAAGVHTLDGLGAVGAGAHTLVEHVETASLVPRARLIAALCQELSSMDRMPPLPSVPASR